MPEGQCRQAMRAIKLLGIRRLQDLADKTKSAALLFEPHDSRSHSLMGEKLNRLAAAMKGNALLHEDVRSAGDIHEALRNFNDDLEANRINPEDLQLGLGLLDFYIQDEREARAQEAEKFKSKMDLCSAGFSLIMKLASVLPESFLTHEARNSIVKTCAIGQESLKLLTHMNAARELWKLGVAVGTMDWVKLTTSCFGILHAVVSSWGICKEWVQEDDLLVQLSKNMDMFFRETRLEFDKIRQILGERNAEILKEICSLHRQGREIKIGINRIQQKILNLDVKIDVLGKKIDANARADWLIKYKAKCDDLSSSEPARTLNKFQKFFINAACMDALIRPYISGDIEAHDAESLRINLEEGRLEWKINLLWTYYQARTKRLISHSQSSRECSSNCVTQFII